MTVDKIFPKMCESFGIFGEIVKIEHIKCGNINDTYRIDIKSNGNTKAYLAQRINHFVFKNPEYIVANVRKVTDHIAEKLRQSNDPDLIRKVLRLYVTNDGEYLYVSPDGDYWRMMNFIFNAKNHSRGDVFLLKKTGEAFGEFQSQLADFDSNLLFEAIPDFHNTPKRFKDLFAAAKADSFNRLRSCEAELDYLKSIYDKASFFQNEYDSGKLKKRVTHNDTKCNNVMFDDTTNEPLAVIDLDTVMPGFAAHDFGDAVRFAANTAAEDETDLNKVLLDISLFEAFAIGFIGKTRGYLSKYELETMPQGVFAITAELSARFLTDYLQNDVYFKTGRANHNLDRTRNQIALCLDIERKMDKMSDIVQKNIQNFQKI